MTNKQYNTSKFEEALKDLDRWVLLSRDGVCPDGTPENMKVLDENTSLVFDIKDGLIFDELGYLLPIDVEIICEFKRLVFSNHKYARIKLVFDQYA